MKNNWIYLLFFLVFSSSVQSQIKEVVTVEIDSIIEDSVLIKLPENSIQNSKSLSLFFKKLQLLKQNKTGKINIVHIGDSHIQADMMTNRVRKNLQNFFGNAGRGFVFPHNLAKTNGSWDIRFSSNQSWNNYRIVAPINDFKVGLSGIALWTKADNFSIELNAKEPGNFFKTIKIISPKNENSFDFSIEKKIISVEKKAPKKIFHTIKKGEAISIIADKYNISISELKNYNRLKSNNIRSGKKLKIPTDEMKIEDAEKSEFVPLLSQIVSNYHYFESDQSLEKIYIIPKKNQKDYFLSGLVLENENAGILYHNIGVNGAKFSDYNKYNLFFEQLKVLQPDLIVLSLGTNESFDKMKADDFLIQMVLFIENVKNQNPNPNAEFLVITTPPSQFQRKFPNIFVADYAQKIINLAVEKNVAVWDMYSQLGGLYGVRSNFKKGIIGNDRVHYTKKGYEFQGDLFSEAILKAFDSFLNAK